VFIPQPILLEVLEILEAHAAHPDTPALHDPIYGLSKEQSADDMSAISAALVMHSGHPASSQIRRLMEEYLELPEPDLALVLQRHGGAPKGGDLVAEVDRCLGRAAEERRVFQARIGALERELADSRRTGNGVAALGAITLIFGLIGWAVGLGVMEVSWIDSPVPVDQAAAKTGSGEPAPGARAVR
jgi:hypothetical protein